MRHIHRAVDVRVVAMAPESTLVLHWAALVLTLNPVVSVNEVLAVVGLVAQAPHNHRRMVVVHLHVVLVALQNLLGKYLLHNGCVLSILEAVALLVGFSRDVETILVAEFVPYGVVGIVACSDGVDVQTLHYLDVLNHTLTSHNVATIWIYLMTIGTLNEYRLSVDEQLTVLDFNLAEAHLLRNHLYNVALAVLDDSKQRI